MKRALLFILVTLSAILSSCSVTKPSTPTKPTNAINASRDYSGTEGLFSKRNQFVIGKTTWVQNARVIQTINPHFALAKNTMGLLFAVSTSDSFDPLYDNLIISGSFVMIKTYTYETREDEYGRTKIKTIPQVVPLRDYQENTIIASE